MAISFYSHPECHKHEMGPGHPEQPARLDSIKEALNTPELEAEILFHEAQRATEEQLKAAHDAAYVERILASEPAGGYLRLDGDTLMNTHSLEAALRAAGAVTGAVDEVINGDIRRAFCAVRPPGHHAERDHAMGFCIFNNIAVGAAHALNHHGLERIAILDFDVHHGNGTEDIFFDEERVLFCSSFQHPFYPFTNLGRVKEHIIKTPLAAGTDGSVFRGKISEQWLPVIDEFRPQLILISAGFDAHSQDHLAQVNLQEPDYQWITEEICKLADSHADGRIISVLEGGYNLSALKRSVTAHLQTLLGKE